MRRSSVFIANLFSIFSLVRSLSSVKSCNRLYLVIFLWLLRLKSSEKGIYFVECLFLFWFWVRKILSIFYQRFEKVVRSSWVMLLLGKLFCLYLCLYVNFVIVLFYFPGKDTKHCYFKVLLNYRILSKLFLAVWCLRWKLTDVFFCFSCDCTHFFMIDWIRLSYYFLFYWSVYFWVIYNYLFNWKNYRIYYLSWLYNAYLSIVLCCNLSFNFITFY